MGCGLSFHSPPAPQVLCLPRLRKTAGLHSSSSQFGTLPRSRSPGVQTCGRSSVLPFYPLSCHTLAHSLALFCTQEKLNSFFPSDSALFAKKHGGRRASSPLVASSYERIFV